MSVPRSIIQASSVEKISAFRDIVKLMNFVYEVVPWGVDQDNSWMQKPWHYQRENVEEVYEKFKKGEIVGWCGSNAQFLSLLLSLYGIKNFGYNYGFKVVGISHVGVVASLDGMQFFLDPYFNRYYTYQGEFPLQFQDLIRLIQERRTDFIKSSYGSSSKRVFVEGGSEELWTPEEFEKSIMDFFIVKGMKKKMLEVFGEFDPLLLLQIRIV